MLNVGDSEVAAFAFASEVEGNGVVAFGEVFRECEEGDDLLLDEGRGGALEGLPVEESGAEYDEDWNESHGLVGCWFPIETPLVVALFGLFK